MSFCVPLTPSCHQTAQPGRRGNFPKNQIAGKLTKDVGNEENEGCDVVIVTVHVQVVLQALNSSISQIGTVDEIDHVKKTNDWHHMYVKSTSQSFLSFQVISQGLG